MSNSKPSSIALPSLDEVRAERCRRSLRYFVAQAWPVVEARPFVPNWHIDTICEHLEAVTRGEIRRLLINIPPRGMKSLTCCVFWPAWEWLADPSIRWLFASYAQNLSTRDAVKARRIIQSQGGSEQGTLMQRVGYQGLLRLLGHDWALTDDQNLKMRYENTEHGYRISTSFGGQVTGEGGDRRVIDDPHKADAVQSQVQRESDLDWYDQTWATRGVNPATDSEVVIMQRLHEADLAGHLLERGGWEHICLPAEYEPAHPFVWPDDPRMSAGDLLWPERMPADYLDQKQVDLGSYGYAGQFQQRPSPAEGGIFQRAWWRTYTELEAKRIAQSWDLSFKDSDSSDFVVGQLWACDQAMRYLLAQIRIRADFVATVAAIRALTAYADALYPKLRAHSIYVEDKANGPAVIAALRKELPGITAVDPRGDKVARAHAVTPQVEAGQVYLPRTLIPAPEGYQPTSTEAFIDEHASFPNGAHDDMVDALTQALDRLRSGSGRRMPRGGGYQQGYLADR